MRVRVRVGVRVRAGVRVGVGVRSRLGARDRARLRVRLCGSAPLNALRSVDLPAPFGPRRIARCPVRVSVRG